MFGVAMSFENDYSLLDRLLHYTALSSSHLQKALFDIESSLYRKQLSKAKSDSEVFVTGLPRAGTTLILDLLYKTGEFTTYTYRNMPFVMSPLLWNKISSPFQKKAIVKERAHGDGMEVSFDSPEAFEEIIWLALCSNDIVKSDFLAPLNDLSVSDEIREIMQGAIKKLILLASANGTQPGGVRYLSKNNANISRIKLISELFPSSMVVVPFRNPADHVGSLMRQHKLFSERHREDKFSQRYMKWLGHYEFGNNLKPINFDGWLDKYQTPYKADENFWLEYWIAAHSSILKFKHENIRLLNYDDLLVNGRAVLERLADFLSIQNKDKLVSGANSLRSPTTQSSSLSSFQDNLQNEALQLYEQLKAQAI